MFSRSNSDPLIFVLSYGKGLTVPVGAPWAFAAPTGPPLVPASRNFVISGYGAQRPRGTGGPVEHQFALQSPCRVPPQLRQLCCPNPTMPNFFLSHKRVKVLRWMEKSGLATPRIQAKTAAIEPRGRRIPRRICQPIAATAEGARVPAGSGLQERAMTGWFDGRWRPV